MTVLIGLCVNKGNPKKMLEKYSFFLIDWIKHLLDDADRSELQIIFITVSFTLI